jgi:succinate dehydrogenase flavin-adding protein (antitoxin of CptAB toxin-antitoxin module)
MNEYTYSDNSKKEIIFKCKAKDILEADLLINKQLNIKVEKYSHIGCHIKFEKKFSGVEWEGHECYDG